MAEKSTSCTYMHFRGVLIKDRCNLNMIPVHNNDECPDKTGKACLVSLGLTQLSVIEWSL